MKAIVISASSDIGTAMCRRWLSLDWQVAGTFRTKSRAVLDLCRAGVELAECDLADNSSVKSACERLRTWMSNWDVLVFCPGTLDPVGPFIDCDMDEWELSFKVNFTAQLRVLRSLLPARDQRNPLGACVLFFAGGGTNSAPERYSAYTVSKIALIKMTELLDAEVPDTRFVIVGPGWVDTKIHIQTLNAGERAGASCERTLQMLRGDGLTQMDRVLDCCDWVIKSGRETVGGRNFSVVHDEWGTIELSSHLAQNRDWFKLRRYGNGCVIGECEKR